LDERLFGPLGMKDTGFWVPAAELGRLAGCYQFDRERGTFEVFDGVGEASDWSRAPAFESGAAGLVSTAGDHDALCRMMLDGVWGARVGSGGVHGVLGGGVWGIMGGASRPTADIGLSQYPGPLVEESHGAIERCPVYEIVNLTTRSGRPRGMNGAHRRPFTTPSVN
jgi:CubicO group peptidase (beta-lactamase class C family)